MAQEERLFPFCCTDKTLMENMLKDVRLAVKDSDAAEEKQAVKEFLQRVSEAFLFTAIGSSGVGKSTFLNRLFDAALFEEENPASAAGIKEYCRGASEASVCVNEYVRRIFRKRDELERIRIADIPGLDRIIQDGLTECVKEYIYKSSVLFVIFDARSVTDYAVWDLLEGVEARKVVFVLTKCDLEKPDVLEEHENRLRRYIDEAGIDAPVFRVSTEQEEGFGQIWAYIQSEVLGGNPTLTKQQESLTELKNMLGRLSESFECRRRQYESDAAVLRDINAALDTFLLNNRVRIDDLKAALSREIEKEVNAYENEVIAKLDPHKIKERFPNGSADFVNYLNLVNESYRKRMTDSVNRRTRETVQGYLSGLEAVFEEAAGYLDKRETILALEDKFYGSMAESKKNMVYRAGAQMEVTRDYYRTLSDASEELFLKLWKERERYERILANADTAGKIAGAGGVVAFAVVKAVQAAATASFGLWPVVCAIIGADVIARLAKKFVSVNTLPQLEKKTAEAVAEFKIEVAKTREEMTAQILETVETMFRLEIENVDRSFSDFRMSVNIEEKNIGMLEDKMRAIDGYLRQIKELEETRGQEP